MAFLPISDKETSIVYSIKNTAKIKKENLIELINLYNPKYKIKEVKKISSFELMSVNLRNYYHKNILAFGKLNNKKDSKIIICPMINIVNSIFPLFKFI